MLTVLRLVFDLTDSLVSAIKTDISVAQAELDTTLAPLRDHAALTSVPLTALEESKK